jgi:hypothetical protein
MRDSLFKYLNVAILTCHPPTWAWSPPWTRSSHSLPESWRAKHKLHMRNGWYGIEQWMLQSINSGGTVPGSQLYVVIESPEILHSVEGNDLLFSRKYPVIFCTTSQWSLEETIAPVCGGLKRIRLPRSSWRELDAQSVDNILKSKLNHWRCKNQVA